MQELIQENIKVDLILTDPPYGTTACKWDTIISFEEMWECIEGLSNPTTPILLFGSEPFSSRLRLSNLKEYKYDWKWNKINGTNIFQRKKVPLTDYEDIMVFYNKAGQYYPIMEKAKKNRSFKRKHSRGYSELYGVQKKETQNYTDTGYRYPKKTIFYNNISGECNNTNRVHPSQKPVPLLEYLINTYTKEDDTVLDFTMGSGSTGVACQNTNRNFIGIELDTEYFKIAEQRIHNTQSKLL